jgi:surface antigen
LDTAGYLVDNNPAVGAIAWYDINSSIYVNPPGLGHVACVNCISGGGNIITLTEYNMQPCIYSTRDVNLSLADTFGNRIPTKFIHTEIGEIGGLGGVGIWEFLSESENEVYVYPNPATDFINVEISDGLKDEDLTFSLFNLIGQLVYEKKIQSSLSTFQIQFLPAGCYIYKITSEVEVKNIGKVIKY